ncbi:maleylacetoacetate isomerase [Polynucleobacter sp. MWH-CaK5]|nr:maleylacetoacetate isomerase [Polynucleobacter sp. MWH-CaK5]
MDIKLFSYWRSSAAFRVRIALNLKNLSHEVIPVDLLKQGGEQHLPSYSAKNPQDLVPVLEHDSHVLRQSLAIIEFLEEVHPTPALLPKNIEERAWVRALSMDIACDIHPLNNLRVMKYLHKELKLSDDQKSSWTKHWLEVGLAGVEKTLSTQARQGKFCLGDDISMADVCLIPQIMNAKASNCDLSNFTKIQQVFDECMKLPAFIEASWEAQTDYPNKS